MVGPTDDGKFLRLKVCSIQRNRSACRVLRAGQAATLALGPFDRSLLRKVRPASRPGGFPGIPHWQGGNEAEMFAGNLMEWEEMARLQSTRSTRLRMGCKPKSQSGGVFVVFGAV